MRNLAAQAIRRNGRTKLSGPRDERMNGLQLTADAERRGSRNSESGKISTVFIKGQWSSKTRPLSNLHMRGLNRSPRVKEQTQTKRFAKGPDLKPFQRRNVRQSPSRQKMTKSKMKKHRTSKRKRKTPQHQQLLNQTSVKENN